MLISGYRELTQITAYQPNDLNDPTDPNIPDDLNDPDDPGLRSHSFPI